MKNRVKKVLSIFMSVLISASFFAGCNEKPKETTTNTLTENEPYTIKIFANFTPASPNPCDKGWAEAVEKANNVKLQFEIPPAANYAERLQVMMAGGEYPDVILFGSHTDKVYRDAVNNGVVIPITQYVKDMPNLQKYTYSISWDAMKVKGDEEIYGIPRTSVMRADGFIVRKDWLDNVGLTIPDSGIVTLDEFKEILKRFTLNDPDKNGKDDTYGFAASTGAAGEMGPVLVWPFGINGWQEHEGKYEYMDETYCKEHDNYKQALQFTADLFKERLIDPNWPVTKRETAIERYKQGVNGVIGEFAGWITQYLGDMKKLNPNVQLTYITGVKGLNGKVEGSAFGTGNWGLFAVTKASKKPDVVVKVFDWMLSDEGWEVTKYGTEGVTYKVENGKKVALPEYSNYQSWGRATMRRNDDPGFFVPLSTSEEMQPKLNAWIGQCIKQAVPSKDRGFRPPAADKPEFIDYGKKMQQTLGKIVTGAAPVSDYDKALEGWYKAGGEEYVTQMNEYIKKAEAGK